MSTLRIYVEGGGNTADQKVQLRLGMEQFLMAGLNDNIRTKQCRVVPCGGRQAAYDAFMNARQRPKAGEITILLVDSEAPVAAPSRREHLRQRPGDGWNLNGVMEDHIHLMAQTMEAWIVADPDALADYYGQDFNRNSLPVRQNLEEESKIDCQNKLEEATRRTQKGRYQKIRHAADLLKKISPTKVRGRCRHAEILFSTLSTLIG